VAANSSGAVETPAAAPQAPPAQPATAETAASDEDADKSVLPDSHMPEAVENAERRAAIMRFNRKGGKRLTGKALAAFKEKNWNKRKFLFDLFLENGEDFETLNVTVNQESLTQESDRNTGVRAWRNREWILTNKYHGNVESTENCIAEKTRLGQLRLDPDGSGQAEYLVTVDDTVVHEDVRQNTTKVNAAAELAACGLAALLPHLAGLPSPSSGANMAATLQALGRKEEDENKKQEDDKKRKEEEDKQERQRVKKEELRQRREEQKNDPIFKAKAFGKSLLQTCAEAKALVARLRACTGLEVADNYIKRLLNDETVLDKLYQELQASINEKDMTKVKKAMDLASKAVGEHHVRYRLARGQVMEMEKIAKEKEDNGSTASGHTGKKSKAK
jgi:hypothetical protein